MSTPLKTISRLTRKIEILESMIEDRSRQAYYETIRRSTINALLESSLKADKIDVFLALVLDLLFSVETLRIDKKGAIFLIDQQGGDLVLHAQSNLPKAHINSIQHLPVNQSFSKQVLSKDSIIHSSEYSNQFIMHLPDMEPHGHYYIPLRTAGRNYGLIILFTANNTQKSKDDINFFSSVADICAGTLERINYSKQILDYQHNLEQQVEEKTRTLLQEKERLAVTLQSIGDGVITTDIDGKILLINKVTEQLTGWMQAEAIGRPVQDIFNIINEETGKPCVNPVDKVLISGRIVGLANHTALIAKDGRQFSIEDSAAPIFDEKNNIIGTVLVFRDVTEERKTAEELLKAKKLESIGVLAGGIAHDFNNILVAILGNIELAGLYISPTNNAYPLLQNAQKASLRAKDLTQQLLTFSKGGDPVKKTIPIGNIITESANFVLLGSPVSCRFSIPDDLWMVNVDAGQIGQVIQNLVINAKYAMPEGGEISINCTNIEDISSESALNLPGKAYIKITVEDTGCGITEKHLENIFDPYFTTRQEGSGLGLAITRSIINKHNGRITVQSKIGEGTTFTIYLPASDDQLCNDPAIQIQEQKNSAGIKILVMDDEQSVLDLVNSMLSSLGHEILLARDGQAAIALFDKHYKSNNPIDLIIMDLTISGGMGGQEAIQEILQIDPKAKAIVSSGYSNDPVMADYRKYGFKAAIAKPYLLMELKKIISNVLS